MPTWRSVRPPGDDRSGRVGSGPRWTRHDAAHSIGPALFPSGANRLHAGHPLHGSTSGSSGKPRRRQKCIIPDVYRIWGWEEIKPGMEGPAEIGNRPTDADSLGWRALPNNSGQLDDPVRRRMGKGIAAPFWSIRGQISKAEFMSQAGSRSNPLRSGSTQHLDSGLRTGVSAPIIWAVLATQDLRQTSPQSTLLLTVWAYLLIHRPAGRGSNHIPGGSRQRLPRCRKAPENALPRYWHME